MHVIGPGPHVSPTAAVSVEVFVPEKIVNMLAKKFLKFAKNPGDVISNVTTGSVGILPSGNVPLMFGSQHLQPPSLQHFVFAPGTQRGGGVCGH